MAEKVFIMRKNTSFVDISRIGDTAIRREQRSSSAMPRPGALTPPTPYRSDASSFECPDIKLMLTTKQAFTITPIPHLHAPHPSTLPRVLTPT